MGVDTPCYSNTPISPDTTNEYGCPDAHPYVDPSYDDSDSFDLVLNETGFDCSTRESWSRVKHMWCCQVFGLCDNAVGGSGRPTTGEVLDDLGDMLALSCHTHSGSPDKCAGLPYCAYEVRDTFGNQTVVDESEDGPEVENDSLFPYLPPMGCVFVVHTYDQPNDVCDCVDRHDPCWEEGNCVESDTCSTNFESMFSNGAVPTGWRHRRATEEAFCTDTNGRRHANGDMWTDAQMPCATFSCFGGQIAHVEMACAPQTCSDPVYTEGQCCGVCEDILPEICTDSNGVRHQDGEDWSSFDRPCSSYSCLDGTIQETVMDCLPSQCSNPVSVPGQCCEVCPDIVIQGSEFCVDSQGNRHREGTQWWKEPEPKRARRGNGDVDGDLLFWSGLNRAGRAMGRSEPRERRQAGSGEGSGGRGCLSSSCIGGEIVESHEACPIFCTAGNGDRHPDGETWTLPDEPCSVFSCTDGDINQQVSSCVHRPTCEDRSTVPAQVDGQCCDVCPEDQPVNLEDCSRVSCAAISACSDGTQALTPAGSCCPSCGHIDDDRDCAGAICAAIAACSDGSRALAPEGSCCPRCDHIDSIDEEQVELCQRGFRMPFEAGEQVRVWNVDLTAFEPASIVGGPNEFGWFVVDHRDGVRSSDLWCPRGPGMGDGSKRGRCVAVDMPAADEGCIAASNDRDTCESDPDCVFKPAKWLLGRNLRMHGDGTTEIGLCIDKQWNEALAPLGSGSGSGSWHRVDCGWLGLKCLGLYNDFDTGLDASGSGSGSGSGSDQATNIKTPTPSPTTKTPTPSPTLRTTPPPTGLPLPDNYVLLGSDSICIKNNAQWASNRGMSAKGGGILPCLAACDNVADCNFAVYTRAQKCQFFKECTRKSNKGGTAIYQRTSRPPSPPAAETPEFTLGGEGFLCKKTQDQYIGGLSGGRNSLDECMVGCGQHDGCRIFSFTSAGYCRYYTSCNQRSDKNGAQVWGLPGEFSVDVSTETFDDGNGADIGVGGVGVGVVVEFPVHSEDTTCAKVSSQIASVFGIKGSGSSLVDCTRHCLAVEDCRFITHTSRGYCKFFKNCDRKQNRNGITTYSRPGMDDAAETPTATFTEHATGQMCDRSPAQIASTPGIKGAGNTLEDCQSGCAGLSDCRFITFTQVGYCRFWKSCNDRITNKPHAIIYAREGAPAAEPADTDGNAATVAAAFEDPIDGQQCDKSAISWASSKGPAGPGHDESDCMVQCLDVPDCHFISMTAAGMCRFFPSCDERLDKRGKIFARRPDAPPPNDADTPDRVQLTRVAKTRGKIAAPQNGGRLGRN